MLNKLTLPATHSLFHSVDLIPDSLTPVPERISSIVFLKGLTSKHEGLIDVINVTSAGL